MLPNHCIKYYGTLRRGWIYDWRCNENDGQSLQTNVCGVPWKSKNVKMAVIEYNQIIIIHIYYYYTDIDAAYCI